MFEDFISIFKFFFLNFNSCFNILKSLRVSWYPFFRDCLVYVVSIVSLIIIIHDDLIHWYESVVLLVLFVLFLLLIIFNRYLEHFWTLTCKIIFILIIFTLFCLKNNKFLKVNKWNESNPRHIMLFNSDSIDISPFDRSRSIDDRDQDEFPLTFSHHPFDPFNFGKSVKLWNKIINFIELPVSVPLYFIIPDCRRKIFEKFPFYFITYFFSTILLGILTFIFTWMCVIIGIFLISCCFFFYYLIVILIIK
jgi:hypothetical protein